MFTLDVLWCYTSKDWLNPYLGISNNLSKELATQWDFGIADYNGYKIMNMTNVTNKLNTL